MKLCTKCHEVKDENDFFVKDKNTGRLHAQCKDCYRLHRKTYYSDHYKKYQDKYLERARSRRKKLREDFRQNMLEYLDGKRCVVCGESDIRVFELDHLDPGQKSFSVSQAVRLGYSWDDVLIELRKCRILCANCHKRHTASQAGWYKNL